MIMGFIKSTGLQTKQQHWHTFSNNFSITSSEASLPIFQNIALAAR